MGEKYLKRSTNKNPDPVISLTRQFTRLMHGRPTKGIKDKPVGGWIRLGESTGVTNNRKYNLVKNRYHSADRSYQMQVDFCYLIKPVKETGGKNAAAIRQCQEFINRCKIELNPVS